MSRPRDVNYERFSADDGRQVHNARGQEILDSTPIAPPIGYRPAPSLAEQIRNMVRSERLAAEAEAAGAETFDEAEDFDVGDDYDPSSPYEADFDLATPDELRRRKAADEADANPPPKPDKEKVEPDDKSGSQLSDPA